MLKWIFLGSIFALAACGEAPELPEHTVEETSLAPRQGQRVQVNVSADISRAECEQLINRYRSDGAPDGQVGVNKPSAKLGGSLAPWCIENFEGDGITFNDSLF